MKRQQPGQTLWADCYSLKRVGISGLFDASFKLILLNGQIWEARHRSEVASFDIFARPSSHFGASFLARPKAYDKPQLRHASPLWIQPVGFLMFRIDSFVH
jgi:hypothetical protein